MMAGIHIIWGITIGVIIAWILIYAATRKLRHDMDVGIDITAELGDRAKQAMRDEEERLYEIKMAEYKAKMDKDRTTRHAKYKKQNEEALRQLNIGLEEDRLCREHVKDE